MDLDLGLGLDLVGAESDHAEDESDDEVDEDGDIGGEFIVIGTVADCAALVESGTSLFLSEAPCTTAVAAIECCWVVVLAVARDERVLGGMMDAAAVSWRRSGDGLRRQYPYGNAWMGVDWCW
jgi:hypothetical protein